MKATGIVRRIDDLGRVVIPKEIRRTLPDPRGRSVIDYIGTVGTILLQHTGAGKTGRVVRKSSRLVSENVVK